MTSNLASGEIAEHALDLRKEQHDIKLQENNRNKIYLYYILIILKLIFLFLIYFICIFVSSKIGLSDKKTKPLEVNEPFISRKFKDKIVKPILKKHFKRDEFLGRINEIVYFLPFSETELKTIVQRELTLWQELVCQKYFTYCLKTILVQS